MPDGTAIAPPAQLMQLLTGKATGSNPDASYRLLRGLAAIGVLEEAGARVFALTPVGACLCVDHPATLADFAKFIGADWHWAIWSELTYSLRTGQTAFNRVHGSAPFDWLAAHPAALNVFNDAMTSLAKTSVPAVIEAYDFSASRRVADVGGGHGSLLSGILERYPGLSGVLFDMPEVVSRARASL